MLAGKIGAKVERRKYSTKFYSNYFVLDRSSLEKVEGSLELLTIFVI